MSTIFYILTFYAGISVKKLFLNNQKNEKKKKIKDTHEIS